MHPPRQFGKRFLVAGLVVLIPVHIGQAPEYRVIPHLLRHPQVLHIAFALRRTIIRRQLRAGNLRKKRRHVIQLFAECLLIGDRGHIRMMVRMITDRMAFLYHALHHLGRRLQKMPYHEKCSLHVMFL